MKNRVYFIEGLVNWLEVNKVSGNVLSKDKIISSVFSTIWTQTWPSFHSLADYFPSVRMDSSEAPIHPICTFDLDSASQAQSRLKFSPISPTSLGQVPLYKTQHAHPYKVILGSTMWNRIRRATETQSTYFFSLQFIYYVLSTVESIDFQCSEIETNLNGPLWMLFGMNIK